jgi:transcriptional regulator of heat shock response
MNDNDIKYRYIKTANRITPENLNKLENIFNFNRDKKVIKEIRKEVEDYERKVMETAEKIEREHLKEGKQNS